MRAAALLACERPTRRAHAPPRARLRDLVAGDVARVDVDVDDRRDMLEARGVAEHAGADRHRVLQLLARDRADRVAARRRAVGRRRRRHRA